DRTPAGLRRCPLGPGEYDGVYLQSLTNCGLARRASEGRSNPRWRVGLRRRTHTMTKRFATDCEGFHRRDFLKIGAGGARGLGVADLLRLEAQAAKRNGGDPSKRRADAVIMVWLAGGPSTIDMWDLKPEAPEGIRGEFKPIPTSARGIEISEHLPKMARVIDKTTIVRSLYHTIPSHGTATVWMTTGNKPTPALQYQALG